MKITFTETTIEADAEELRECRTLSDCLVSFLKMATPTETRSRRLEEDADANKQ